MDRTWKTTSPDHVIKLDVIAVEGGDVQGSLSCAGITYKVSGSWGTGSPSIGQSTSFSMAGSASPDPKLPDAFNYISISGAIAGDGTTPRRITTAITVASSIHGTIEDHDAVLYPTPDIRHVFVLMLENRSFDHMLGGLGITGLDADTGLPTAVDGVVAGDARFSNSFAGTSYTARAKALDPMSSDPSHEFPDTLEQLCSSIDDGTKQNPFPKGPYPPIDNGGFAKSYAKVLKVTKPDDRIGEVMAFCTQDQIPVLYKLATEFAVCDNWFSSVPGPTMPNRLFAMGATACGMDRSNNWNDVTSWTVSGFSYLRGSFFDRLTANNKSYGLYFDSHFDPPGHSRAGSFPMAVFLKNIHAWNFAYMQSNAPGIAWPFSSHGDPFVTAVKKVDPKTNLPTYPHLFTWIEPNYGYQFNPGSGSSQHPRDTLAGGEELIATVYNALRASEIWENSVLIITWDEHGGYYDHVAPPEAAPPGDGTRFNDGPYSPGYKFDFSRMGVRVPAIVVSPLIPKNTIDHRQYDHTTILRTVEDLLGIAPLTARDEASSNLFGLFSLDKARSDCPVTVAAKSATTATRTATPADANDPVPQSGTIVSTVLIALKSQLEIDGSDTSKRDQAILQVDSIKTNSDAKAYLDSVYTMMQPPSEGK